MTLSYSDLSVWCYACDDYIDNQVGTLSLTQEHLMTLSYTLTPVRVCQLHYEAGRFFIYSVGAPYNT